MPGPQLAKTLLSLPRLDKAFPTCPKHADPLQPRPQDAEESLLRPVADDDGKTLSVVHCME